MLTQMNQFKKDFSPLMPDSNKPGGQSIGGVFHRRDGEPDQVQNPTV